jgi:adenylate cyclase
VRDDAQAVRWGEETLAAAIAVRDLELSSLPPLPDLAIEDHTSLLAGIARLEALLADAENQDAHELRNVLDAVRGYAEMLRESLGEGHGALDTSLHDLLQTTSGPPELASDSVEEPPALPESLASEPGFILAVDDRRENRELVARYLTRSGHFVVTAESGEQALKTMAESDVDVVLLDLVMPGMDGREVLARIKANEDWRATPVIVISGQQDMEGIIDCIEAGADDYLFKPFNPVLLQARIKAGIERKRWHDREELYRQQLERNERFIRATFGRYLSDDIVTDILERPEGLELGGNLREVTIMMSDIRGFTTLVEQLAPDQVVRMLNRYLGVMTDIIMEFKGTIDEFLGDAILAVFGAPQLQEDHADRALHCALAMQAAMNDINAENRRDGLPEIATAIAINTGTVIAGNIGSERRSKYGFVGHPMNVTSRIEDATRGGEVLAAASTIASCSGEYRIEAAETLQVKGIEEPVQVHRVSPAQPPREGVA